jgi:hypothetical protein
MTIKIIKLIRMFAMQFNGNVKLSDDIKMISYVSFCSTIRNESSASREAHTRLSSRLIAMGNARAVRKSKENPLFQWIGKAPRSPRLGRGMRRNSHPSLFPCPCPPPPTMPATQIRVLPLVRTLPGVHQSYKKVIWHILRAAAGGSIL